MRYLLGLIILVLCISCSNRSEEKAFVESLSKMESEKEFSLDSLITSNTWDSVYVLAPYTNTDPLDIDGLSNRLKSEIGGELRTEANCGLIFVSNNSLVSYVILPRRIADFCLLDSIKYPIHQRYKLCDKRIVIPIRSQKTI